jgi:putative ABC transport system permease protein
MNSIFVTVVEECRRAARTLWRRGAFSFSVVTLLALTVGTVTAGGAAAYELLWGRLPYGTQHQLVMIWGDLPKAGYARSPLSGPEVVDIRAGSRGLAAPAVISAANVSINQADDPVQVSTANVTSHFFDVLRVTPALGRTFVADDEGGGPSRVMVLSWSLFQSRFGGDPDVVGRRILYAGEMREIVGVMPASFRMAFPPDANIPVATEAWLMLPWRVLQAGRHQYFARVMGRMREGATTTALSTELTAIGEAVERAYPGYGASGRRFLPSASNETSRRRCAGPRPPFSSLVASW